MKETTAATIAIFVIALVELFVAHRNAAYWNGQVDGRNNEMP